MRRATLLALCACGTSAPRSTPADAAPDSPPFDAAADAADETGSDVGASTWCDTRAPAPAFCDDFDRGELGARWDFFQTDPPGVATLDQAAFVSAPDAFGVVTKKLTGPDFGTILLRKTISGTFTRARLGFDLFADAAQPTGTLAVATLDLSLDHLLTLYLRDDDPDAPAATLTEQPPAGAPAVRHPLSAPPQPAAWTRVELAVDSGAATATLVFDGAVVLTAPIAKAPMDSPTVRVGVLVSGPAGPYTMRFDDVALDLTP